MIKIDNHFPDMDCIVVDTKKYRITVARDEDGEVTVAVFDKLNNYAVPMQEFVLGKESPK
jgi:hypothetical protein